MWTYIKTPYQAAARLDWRVRAVVAASAATLLATAFVYWQGWGLNPSTHFGSIFASWVSGVALFIVAGSVVALVSLARPEGESFDARARILFRRQTGKHIDYIVTKITEILEHYAERTTIKVTVHDYDPAEGKYRISALSHVVVRSYLDDIVTTYSSHLGLKDVTLPPAGGQANRVMFIRVGQETIGKSENFTTEVHRPLSCQVEADGSCEITTMIDYWLQADTEPNVHRPRRYTQLLALHFENLTNSDHDLTVTVSRKGNTPVSEQLAPGTSRQVLEIRDIKPDQVAYDFRILKP